MPWEGVLQATAWSHCRGGSGWRLRGLHCGTMKPLQLGPTQHAQAWESWHLAQSRPCEAEGPIVMRSVGLRRVRLLKLARTKASVAEQGEERCGFPRELNKCLNFTRTGSRRHMMWESHFHARLLCSGPELSAGQQTRNRSGGHCCPAGHLVGRLMGSNWSGSWPSGTWGRETRRRGRQLLHLAPALAQALQHTRCRWRSWRHAQI